MLLRLMVSVIIKKRPGIDSKEGIVSFQLLNYYYYQTYVPTEVNFPGQLASK